MITPEGIIDRITHLQSTGNSLYASGLFPSQRVNSYLGYQREDNNIYFSALVIFTLEQLQNRLNEELVVRISSIKKAVIANYPKYLHKKSPDTYNFWPGGSGQHFPHGWILHRISKLALPADTDDTSLVYLTKSNPSGIKQLKHLYENQYATQAPLSPLTPPAYADLKAYPSFLGKRMVREMDACIISNVLFMVFLHQLNLSPTDYDSIEYLSRVLKRQDYINAPFEVSPHYGNSSVILYHLARLVAFFNDRPLNDLKQQLIVELQAQGDKELPVMEKLLIDSSLFRLGMAPSPVSLDTVQDSFKDFYFFQAGMLTGLQLGLLKKLASNSFFHLRYRCEAYYWALVLEYLVLSENY